VASLRGDEPESEIVVVLNAAAPPEGDDPIVPPGVHLTTAGANLGVPGGRDLGVAVTDAPIIGFLDDDAVLSPGATRRLIEIFDERPDVGAVSLRLVDERGETSRRHVPRRGASGATESGDVALFLGGACAIRRSAYESVGGYFTDLHYGHEELELSWRLIDAGWAITYLADVTVFHPRTEISRHADGWLLTGRNRVWIARRTLPWPVALIHVTLWLALGVRRAPAGCRAAYLRGWASGWRGPVGRSPIGWRTVARLARLGRPPLF
jgi:GT2 family glycosyltransferase